MTANAAFVYKWQFSIHRWPPWHSGIVSKRAELREMAYRRHLGAEALARKENPDTDRAKRKQKLAQDLFAKADEAEEKSLELQRQVPHGMLR